MTTAQMRKRTTSSGQTVCVTPVVFALDMGLSHLLDVCSGGYRFHLEDGGAVL